MGGDVVGTFVVTGTANGPAVAPADHSLANGTITIPAGQLAANLTLNIAEDTLVEAAETITITLSSAVGATVGAPAVHTATIQDNDVLPIVQWDLAAQALAESATTVSIRASINKASASAVSVPYTVAGTATGGGSDYAGLVSGTLSIAAGATSAALTFTIVDDNVAEGIETIVVSLGAATGATVGTNRDHTVTINANDSLPSLQFSLASQTVAENIGKVTATLTLSSASAQAIAVPITLSGTARNGVDFDYDVNSTYTLAAGATSLAVSFTVINDTMDEAAETAVLAIGTLVGAVLGTNAQHTVNITDDDPIPTLVFALASSSIVETTTTALLQVKLSNASSQPIQASYSVGGTASSGSDHSLVAGIITFNPGEAASNLSVPILADTLIEAHETLVVALSAPTNAMLGSPTTHTYHFG